MIIEISIAIAVLIFAILAFFVIRTLLSFQKSMKRFDFIAIEIEMKLKNLDSSFQTFSNLGDIAERKTEEIKKHFLSEPHEKGREEMEIDPTVDLIAWLLSTLKLGIKILTKR